jgi:hypothetical protein
MGIEPMPITDTTCRTGKSREKPYKLSDGGGIYLLVEKNGSKLWCHAFRIDGKQSSLRSARIRGARGPRR